MLSTRHGLLAIAFGLTGCIEQAEDIQLGEVQSELCLPAWGPTACNGCGFNGLRRAAYNNIFAQMDRNALHNYGLWDWNANGPVSICDPNQTKTGSSCVMRAGWANWMNGGTWVRRDMMENLVKLIAPKCFNISGGGQTYAGEYNISPIARDGSWGPTEQEYISAGFLSLLNSVEGVPICLNTDRDSTRCAGSGAVYHEGTFFGNAIQGSPRFMAIAGGFDYRNPWVNPRYGTVAGVEATIYQYSSWRCAGGGSGESRYASYCDKDGGGRYQHPVTVLVPTAP
jgi:hypothetical protein